MQGLALRVPTLGVVLVSGCSCSFHPGKICTRSDTTLGQTVYWCSTLQWRMCGGETAIKCPHPWDLAFMEYMETEGQWSDGQFMYSLHERVPLHCSFSFYNKMRIILSNLSEINFTTKLHLFFSRVLRQELIWLLNINALHCYCTSSYSQPLYVPHSSQSC